MLLVRQVYRILRGWFFPYSLVVLAEFLICKLLRLPEDLGISLRQHRCWSCGKPTHFYSFGFEVPICRAPCFQREWDRYAYLTHTYVLLEDKEAYLRFLNRVDLGQCLEGIR